MSLILTWLSSDSATGYEVRTGRINQTPEPILDVGNVLTYQFTDLIENTLYIGQVRAYDASGNRSSWATTVPTFWQAPSVPVVSSFVANSDTELTLNWSASTDNVAVTGYEVRIRLTSGSYGAWTDVGNVLTHQFTGLDDDTSYTAQVRAYDAAGNYSAASTEAVQSTDAAAPIAFIDSAGATNGASGPATTSPMDTAGADLIVLGISFIDGHTMTPTDSESNAWTPLTAYLGEGPFADVRTQLFYCINPTTDGSHTFSTNGGTNYASISVAAFSLAAGGFDAATGAGSVGGSGDTTIQPGSITPAQANSLLVTACGYVGAATATINSGFSEVEDIDNYAAGGFSVALAYKIQTTATAENPTWSSNTAADRISAAMAAFEHS